MESLYGVFANGEMFYLRGSLTPEEREAVERLAGALGPGEAGSTGARRCRQLIAAVEDRLHVTLEAVPLEHVFRLP